MTTHETSADPYVMIDNYQFLRKHIFTKITNQRQFDSWYDRIFAPSFFEHDEPGPYLCFPPEQTGGGTQDYIYTRSEGHQEYHLRIRYFEVRDQSDQNLGSIYLISPIDDDSKHYCVYGRITQERPNVVELRDLVLAFNCTDYHSTPHKIGKIYVEVMTQFLIEHHRSLGITQIELVDNAHYRCPKKLDLILQLEKTRQLEGKDPYYMQFGYQPKFRRTANKLAYNKHVMSQILTKDVLELARLCQDHDCQPEIFQYIQDHPEQSMSQTMKYIGRYDCVVYSEIHRQMFKNCGLKELEQPIYVMNFEET